MKGRIAGPLKIISAVLIFVTCGLVSYALSTHLVFSITPSAGARLFFRLKCSEDFQRYRPVEFLPLPSDRIVPKGIKLIKQVACFPGERIIRRGKHFYCLTREGLRLDLGPIKFRTRDGRPLTPWLADNEEAVVPHGHIFVIGDGTPHSYDSRYFGPIPVRRVLSCPVPIF